MSLLGYAIVASGRDLAGIAGLRGAPVWALEAGPLAAAVSELDAAEALAAIPFARVVAALQERCGAVVPLRLGCRFRDAEAARAAIAERAGELLRLLSEFDGCREWSVRIGGQPAAPPPGTAASGLAWLSARRAHYDAIEEGASARRRIAEDLLRAAAGLYRRTRQEPLRDALAVHFLVPQSTAAAWRGCVDGLGLPVSGPWPPYNFVEP